MWRRIADHPLVVTGVVALMSGYVLLGLFDGVLGVAWSQVRAEFARPVSDLPYMWVPHALGYLFAALASGPMVRRFQPRRVLLVGCALAVFGLVQVVVAQSMWWLSIAILPVGVGNGLLDSAGNTYVTLTHGPRIMHGLHSAYGVGVTLGPLLAAGVIDLDWSWRVTYLVIMALQFLVLLAMLRLRRAGGADDDAEPTHYEGFRGGLAVLLVAFSVYVSLEIGVGQWTFSVLVDSRGFNEGAAGVVVAAYWGALLVGRLVLAALDHRVDSWASLRFSAVALLVGALLFLIDPAGLGFVGALLLGAGAAAVFPTMVLLTPQVVGTRRVADAVGMQFAVSALAAIASAVLIGFTVSRSGISVASTWYLGLAVAFACSMVLLRRLGAAAERQGR